MEELQLEYELKLYHRDPVTKLAPAALSGVYPLGKSPILELDYLDGKETKKLAESGHIINYLIKHFDSKGKLKPETEEDEEEVDYYLHFSESTLQPYLTYSFFHERAYESSAESSKPAIGKFLEVVDGSYTTPELIKTLDLLEGKLKKKCEELSYTSSSKEVYFVGHKLSGADIIFEFNLQLAFGNPDHIKPIHRTNYVFLSKWLSQVKHRPAYVRSVEIIESQGNKEYEIYF